MAAAVLFCFSSRKFFDILFSIHLASIGLYLVYFLHWQYYCQSRAKLIGNWALFGTFQTGASMNARIAHPPHPSKLTTFFIGIFLSLVLLIGAGWQYVHASPTMATQSLPPELEGNTFYIGGFTSDELFPALAYSVMTDQYLVVFQTDAGNGNVWAQYVDAYTGELVGPTFPISNDPDSYEGNPDVVYDSVYVRFLVIWDEVVCIGVPAHCNYVIKGRVLHASDQNGGSNFAGDEFTIASQWSSITSGYDLRDPAVAYNSDAGEYGVVFIRGHQSTGYTDIYGQIVEADASSPTVLTPNSGFEMWATTDREMKTPDIAWGSAGNTFAAAWNAERPNDTNYIAITYLYDTYQFGGSQVNNTVLVAPLGSLQYDTRQPAIAYDSVNDNYALVFVHQEGADPLSPTTIRGKHLKTTYDAGGVTLNSFDVKTTIDVDEDYHRYPNIAFSPFDEQMHVSYSTNGTYDDFPFTVVNRTFTRVIDSDNVVSDRLEVAYSGELGIDHTALACTVYGSCLVTWREEYGDPDWDILGQRTRVNCYDLTLSIGSGAGSITQDLGENCNDGAQYRNGTTVELTATGDELGQYTFDHWTGSLTGSQNPASLLINGDKTVTAHFVSTQPGLDKYVFLPAVVR